MKKEFLNPPDLPNWGQVFSQVVVVKGTAADTVYVAGQVSVDKDKNLIGPGDLKTQAEQSFKNLEIALGAAGATTADVVRMNIYVKHYQPADAAIIGEALQMSFRQQENLPATTWLGVETLAQEGFLIEIDAIAVVQL
jgi:enamine deaminase RidA (YjgF/YER057c/UK114 family)